MTSTGGLERESTSACGPVERIVVIAVLAAAAPLGFLHLTSIGSFDPASDVISDYVFQPGGYALLGAAALSLATGCVALSVALRRAGLPHAGAPAGWLLAAAVALLLVALFPTHAPGTTPGLVSTVHRVAGATAFAAIPMACWLVARRARYVAAWAPAAPALTWGSAVAGGISTGFLLNHVPIVITGSPGFPLVGALQRVLFVAVMVVLVMTARATRLAAERAHGAAAVSGGAPPRDTSLRGVS